jgi:hypothetical protein
MRRTRSYELPAARQGAACFGFVNASRTAGLLNGEVTRRLEQLLVTH